MVEETVVLVKRIPQEVPRIREGTEEIQSISQDRISERIFERVDFLDPGHELWKKLHEREGVRRGSGQAWVSSVALG